MREINEYAAEVFRRSEKRIRERRRTRTRVFGLCIPFCLVALVCAAMILPGMTRTKNENDEADHAIMVPGIEESFGSSYATVQIRKGDLGPEHSEKVTDPAAVAEALRTVQSLFAEDDKTELSGEANFEVGVDAEIAPSLPEGAWANAAITIIFTDAVGEQTVYTLSENALFNEATRETAFLSDAQVTELMGVFGISE